MTRSAPESTSGCSSRASASPGPAQVPYVNELEELLGALPSHGMRLLDGRRAVG
ncbi:MAG: hypothetical protein ABSB52_07740 [Acidimicrobiales bacterium]